MVLLVYLKYFILTYLMASLVYTYQPVLKFWLYFLCIGWVLNPIPDARTSSSSFFLEHILYFLFVQ